jgi:hypothetical protein
MGVPGLLQGLRPFVRRGSVRDYSGRSVAVDLSSWLHKSVYSVADSFVEETAAAAPLADDDAAAGAETNGAASACSSSPRSLQVSSQYVVQRCQELLRFAGVSKIYLVMDGRRWCVLALAAVVVVVLVVVVCRGCAARLPVDSANRDATS